MTRRRIALPALLLPLVLAALSGPAPAQTAPTAAPPAKATKAGPPRDLLVELRQVEEGGGGYVVGTRPGPPLLAPQQVQVRNGERATLRLGQSIAVQWVKSARSHTGTLAAGGASATSSGGGVTQELMWMDAGQSLSVRPQWPGGQQPVTLEVEVQSAGVDPHAGAMAGSNLPVQSRSQLATTVTAPLGQWVTVASSGAAPQRGVYGSEAAAEARRLLQLRVLAP